MPRSAKGVRLWLRPERRDKRGRVSHPAVYIILDGQFQRSTRCGPRLRALKKNCGVTSARPVLRKRRRKAPVLQLHIWIADVIALYARDVAPTHARPDETAARLDRLLEFWGDKRLSAVNGAECRAYAKRRPTPTTARRELEIFAQRLIITDGKVCVAIVEHRAPGSRSVPATLAAPGRGGPPVLGRLAIPRAPEGICNGRRIGPARCAFILVALYTGTRAGAVCGAALAPTEGHGWIDLGRGVFYRRPRRRETKKRQPPVPLPAELLGHLRRWKRRGQRFASNGRQARQGDPKGFGGREGRRAWPDVTPHMLRHSAATWLMQHGTDAWEASGYLGMTSRRWARLRPPPSGPPHGARSLRSSPPMARQSTATEREQTSYEHQENR